MALSGNLQDIALPDILQLLAAQGLSGQLTLCRGPEKVRLAIFEGKAVESDSNRRSLHRRLGTMLVRAGRLRESDLEQALRLQKQSGRRLGEILVAERLAAREDVARALRIQVLQIIYEVLRWVEGNYDFERCAVDFDRANLEPVGFQQILMDGMRMIDEWPMIDRLIRRHTILQRHPAGPRSEGEIGTSDPLTTDEPPRESPTPAVLPGLEAEVYALVDGRSTVQQIIDGCMQFEFDVCRSLYDLVGKGLIRPAYEGRLEEMGFPDLLLVLRRTRVSGRLELDRGDVSAVVRFRDGEMVAAETSDPDDALGPRLFARGWIRRRDLEDARPEVTTTTDLGPELVRSGVIAEAQLAREMDELHADIVLSLFSWRQGSFRFRPGAAEGPILSDLERRSPAIILKGIRSIDRWSRLAQAVGPAHTTYRRARTGTSEALTVLAGEYQSLLDLFASDRTLADAADRADVPEFFTYQLVWTMLVLGLLERDRLPPRAELLIAALSGEPPAEMTDDMPHADEVAEVPPAAVPPPIVTEPTRPTAPSPPAPLVELDLDAVAARVTAGMSAMDFMAMPDPRAVSEADFAQDLAPDDLSGDGELAHTPAASGIHTPWARTPARASG